MNAAISPPAFGDHRDRARAILVRALEGAVDLRPMEAQFLGGLSFDANSLTEKQGKWLAKLEAKHAPFLSPGERS